MTEVRQCKVCGVPFPIDDPEIRGMVAYEHMISEHDDDIDNELIEDVREYHQMLIDEVDNPEKYL